MEFKLVQIEDRIKFFEDNYPFKNPPAMTDKVRCIHCGREYPVEAYKVVKDPHNNFLYISCAYAPSCDGTVIDWVRIKERLRKDKHKVFEDYKEFFSETIYNFKGKRVKKLVKQLKHNREKTMRRYFKFIYDMVDTYVVVDELYPDHVVEEENTILESKSDKFKKFTQNNIV
jgi:hypothetical protein